MRKIITLILTIISFFNIAYAQKSQLAIFVYNSNSTIPTNALRSQLTNSFIEGGNSDYDIVDRTDEILDLLVREYRYQGSGMVKDDNIISAGEHLGANFICAVAITEYPGPDGYFFESKIVDVAKRQIIKNALYPNDEQQAVTSMGVKKQLEIAKSLAKQLDLFSTEQLIKERKNIKLNIGDSYEQPDGKFKGYRIGYLDGTGKHGLAYLVCGLYGHPGKGNSTTCSELLLLYKNKLILGLEGEYWSGEIAKGNYSNFYEAYFYTIDFTTGHRNIRHGSNPKNTCYGISIISF